MAIIAEVRRGREGRVKNRLDIFRHTMMATTVIIS